MGRDYDKRTGRPLVNGRDSIRELTDQELELEVTIAACQPQRRSTRLDALLDEQRRRRDAGALQPA